MPLFSVKAPNHCARVNKSQNMFALPGAKLRCRCHIEFARIAVEPAGVDKEEEVAINEEVAAAVEELAPLPVYEDRPTRQCPISDPVLLGVDFLQEGIELIQSIHSAAGTSPQQELIPVEVYRCVLRSIGKIRLTCVQIRDRLSFTRRHLWEGDVDMVRLPPRYWPPHRLLRR